MRHGEFEDPRLVEVYDATCPWSREDELRTSLGGAGFVADEIFGGWRREPVGRGDGEFLVIARRDEMT